ncbi:DUF3261 domain-containing protein [Vibrio amylolyticus]
MSQRQDSVRTIRQPGALLNALNIKLIFTLILALMTNGCAMTSTSSNPLSSAQVEISPDVFIALPTPVQLGYNVTASQLISASWPSDSEQANQQQTLPVHLEVNDDQVVLAGFSSWGTRILSLTYKNETIETSVLTGLENSLPEPEQILFNLMITLWPLNAWEGPLNQVEWQISEMANKRTIYDKDGDAVIRIDYQHSDPLSGLIQFTHEQLGYSISIQTLDVDRTLGVDRTLDVGRKDPTTHD